MITPVTPHKNSKTKPVSSDARASVFAMDKILIEGCLNGDQAAWKKLVDKYQRLVYSIPLRMGLSASDADEVFQNVFMITVRDLPKLRNQTVFAAWLITITRNESLRVREQSSRYANKNYEFKATADPAQSDELEAWEMQNMLHQALERLDPQSRQLIIALFLESPTPNYREIAARLGIAEGSVGPLRARAFKKLEAILIEMGFDNNP